MPIRIEVLRTSLTSAVAQRPSNIALRQSVLSLIGNQVCSTDQGQTIYNDTNTAMINNLRLEIENDYGWLWSESQDLDYSLDRLNPLPAQNTTSYGSVLAGPAYAWFQGVENGAQNGAPITNDPSEFGNATLGAFTATYAAFTPGTTNPGITAFNGTAITASTSAGQFLVTFPDGRIAYVPYVSGTTYVSSIGGVTVGNGTSNAVLTVAIPGLVAGSTYTQQAVGFTNVLNQPIQAEEVTVPITFTAVSATTVVVTSIGGVALTAAGTTSTLQAYGQNSGRNPGFNQGFLERVTVFQNDAIYTNVPAGTNTPGGQVNTNGADVWQYVARIPLKLLHDFWMQLNFPVINVGFNLQLYFNQGNGVAASTAPLFPVFQTDANASLISGGTNATPNPAIFYGQGQGTTCRLYYRSVKFSPADNARAAQMLTTGFTKAVKFISTDWNQMQSLVPANNGVVGNIVQYQITNSVVHPLRLWVLGYLFTSNTTGASPPTGQFAPSALVNVLNQPWYAPGVVTGHFINTNVNINNVPCQPCQSTPHTLQNQRQRNCRQYRHAHSRPRSRRTLTHTCCMHM